MRTSILILSLGALWLAAASNNAAAFSEVDTTTAVPGIAVTNTPEPLADSDGSYVADRLPALRMIDPAASAREDEGMVLSIPGIGRIGTLPKFDFGLELLYGSPEAQGLSYQGDPGPAGQAPEDDVIIRGTIKHKF